MTNRSLSYLAYRSIWGMLDLMFPPVCGGCGKEGSGWCGDCQNKVQVLNGNLCEVCGLPQDGSSVCNSCIADRPHYRALRAWAVFDNPVRKALHSLKYHRNISMGLSLAEHMSGFVKDLNWTIDMVIPIPLGRQRMKERGYNQVAMIAKPLALSLEIQYTPDQLWRSKETRTQVGLSSVERKENVRSAFAAGKGVAGKSVLVMDDVSTTGSTLSSSAEALFASGAKDVFALTVARALPHHGLGHA